MKTEFVNVGMVGTQQVGFHTLTLNESKKPRVCLLASIHGDEITPHYIIRRILERAHTLPMQLCIIPDANQLALAARQRVTPQDHTDLNRVFPGNAAGTITERLAAKLFAFVRSFDMVIELHTFENMEMGLLGIIPTVTGELSPRALHALTACKPDFIWKPHIARTEEKRYSGALGMVLAQHGVDAFVLEFPSSRICDEKELDQYASQLIEMLHHFDEKPSAIPPIIERYEVKSPYAGIFNPRCAIGATLTPGTVIGAITSLPSYEVHTVVAEETGVLLQHVQKTFINIGDVIYALGKPFRVESFKNQS